jgi:hypothetical protein
MKRHIVGVYLRRPHGATNGVYRHGNKKTWHVYYIDVDEDNRGTFGSFKISPLEVPIYRLQVVKIKRGKND